MQWEKPNNNEKEEDWTTIREEPNNNKRNWTTIER